LYGLLQFVPANDHEKNVKKRFFCSLCNYLAHKYGNISRYFVNHDAAFLSILSSAQMPEETALREGGRCVLWNHRFVNVKELEYAGAVALLMGRSKMLDSYYDSGSTVSDVMIRMLNRKSVEAEKVLKRLDFPSTIFDEQMRRQHALERMEGDATLEELCEPTGRVVSKVFEHTASLSGMNENREALSLIGSDLGSLMYVLDSYTDISDDVSENKFNPFIACRSIEPVLNRGNLNRIFKISWDFSRQRLLRIKENCERLYVRRYGSLVLRTLTTDLERRMQAILSAVNSRKRETNLLKNQLLPAIALVGFKLKTQNGDCEDCFLCWDVGDCTMALTSMVVEHVLTATATGGGAAVIGGAAASVISNVFNRPSEPSAPEETPEEQLGEPEEEELEDFEPSETDLKPEPETVPEDKIKEVWTVRIDDLPKIPEMPTKDIRDTDQTVPEVPRKGTSTINPPEDVPPRDQIASSDDSFIGAVWDHVFGPKPDSGPPTEEDRARAPHVFGDKEEPALDTLTKHWGKEPLSPEDRAKTDEAQREAGRKLTEGPAVFGPASFRPGGLLEALTRYQSEEQRTKLILEELQKADACDWGKTMIQCLKTLNLASSSLEPVEPGKLIPDSPKVAPASDLQDFARRLGEGYRMRDWSGAVDAAEDLVIPDTYEMLDWIHEGLYRDDNLMRQAQEQFRTVHGENPDPNKPEDVRRWLSILKELK